MKDKLDDDNLDLSMCDLKSVPVKEIAELQRARKLNLSFNNLIFLPEDFYKLEHIRDLDLSKNHLKALPKNFGRLSNLKRLDLLSNDLEGLPLSFCELKSLQWLDLKDNPLNSKLKQVAGDCLNEVQCKKCAVNVLKYMKEQQAEEDRRVQELLKLKREEELKKKIAEEEEQKRLKEIKKLEKELKKQEMLKKKQTEREEKLIKESQQNTREESFEHKDAVKKITVRKKPFILRLLNFVFLISFFLFLIFILLSVYCDKFTNFKLFDAKTFQFGVLIQKNLNQICVKYDFQFKYLVNHFKKQFKF